MATQILHHQARLMQVDITRKVPHLLWIPVFCHHNLTKDVLCILKTIMDQSCPNTEWGVHNFLYPILKMTPRRCKDHPRPQYLHAFVQFIQVMFGGNDPIAWHSLRIFILFLCCLLLSSYSELTHIRSDKSLLFYIYLHTWQYIPNQRQQCVICGKVCTSCWRFQWEYEIKIWNCNLSLKAYPVPKMLLRWSHFFRWDFTALKISQKKKPFPFCSCCSISYRFENIVVLSFWTLMNPSNCDINILDYCYWILNASLMNTFISLTEMYTLGRNVV